MRNNIKKSTSLITWRPQKGKPFVAHGLERQFIKSLQYKERDHNFDSDESAQDTAGYPYPFLQYDYSFHAPRDQMLSSLSHFVEKVFQVSDYLSSQTVSFFLDPSFFGSTSVKIFERYGSIHIMIKPNDPEVVALLQHYLPMMFKELLKEKSKRRTFRVELYDEDQVYVLSSEDEEISHGHWLSLG